jgi:hypothetical protein
VAAKVEGLKQLIDALDGRRRDAKRFHGLRLAVGYSAPYAIYVHENLQAHHPVGQAKFLETPARRHAKEIKRTVARALKSGTPPASAMSLGGIHLLSLSRPLVPVDTGVLRESGYVRVEGSKSGGVIPGGGD